MSDKKEYPMPDMNEQEREDMISYLTSTRGFTELQADRFERLAEKISLVVLTSVNREPDYYIHRIERCDAYGPEVELRAYNSILDAMKSVDDHGGHFIPVYASQEVKE